MMQKIFTYIDTPKLLLIAIVFTIQACASYPTQELSDARQAVRAAEAVGAGQHLPEVYNNALTLLSKAETELKMPAPAYSEVRSTALAAKDEAVKARQLTVALTDAQKAIEKFETPKITLIEAKQALAKSNAAIEEKNFDEAIKYAKLARNLAIQGR